MCARRVFNPEKEEFISNYEKLGSCDEMSKFYGFGRTTIARYAKKIGYVNNQRKDISWSPDSEEEFIQKYIELKSKNKMSEFYGVCDRTILKYAKKINFINYYRPSLTQEERKYVISQYNNKTAIRLAGELGVSKPLITKIWREEGQIGKQSRRYYINENYFETIDSFHKAYFLGVIASDGCVYSHKNLNKLKMLSFKFHIQEREIIELFIKYSQATYQPIIQEDKIGLQINSDKMVSDLYKYNIIERKTWTYCPINLENKLMWHFVRGYFDGDGSIYLSGKNIPSNWVVNICGNKETIDFFHSFFKSQGIESKISQDKRINKYTFDFYYLIIKKNSEKIKFFNKLYNNSSEMRLTRKYHKYLEFIKIYNNTPS